jgi:hypothetical protein
VANVVCAWQLAYATQIFFSTVFFLQTTQLVQHVLSKSLDVGVGGSFCRGSSCPSLLERLPVPVASDRARFSTSSVDSDAVLFSSNLSSGGVLGTGKERSHVG